MTLLTMLWIVLGYIAIGEIAYAVLKSKIESVVLSEEVSWSLRIGIRFVWVFVAVTILVIGSLIVARRLRSP